MPPVQVDTVPRDRQIVQPIGEDVADFSRRHNLTELLVKAFALAKSSFTGVLSITTEMEIDPDSDDEFIVVIVTVHGSIDEIPFQIGRLSSW